MIEAMKACFFEICEVVVFSMITRALVNSLSGHAFMQLLTFIACSVLITRYWISKE